MENKFLNQWQRQAGSSNILRILHTRAWMWILSSSGQLDISRVSSEWVRYRVEHENIKFISMYSVYYINTSEITSQPLTFKGAIYYVTITTVISSRVKITCYLHVWRYEVFAGKLTWYFTAVYMINYYSVCTEDIVRKYIVSTHWYLSFDNNWVSPSVKVCVNSILSVYLNKA